MPEVVEASCFRKRVETLRGGYPEIDAVVEDLRETLRFADRLPNIAWNIPSHPDVQVCFADYPADGAAGCRRFLVTYHRELRDISMSQPSCTTTLLTIIEAPREDAEE